MAYKWQAKQVATSEKKHENTLMIYHFFGKKKVYLS